MIFQYFLSTITIRNDYFQRIIIKIVVKALFFFFFIIDANVDVISLFSNFFIEIIRIKLRKRLRKSCLMVSLEMNQFQRFILILL